VYVYLYEICKVPPLQHYATPLAQHRNQKSYVPVSVAYDGGGNMMANIQISHNVTILSYFNYLRKPVNVTVIRIEYSEKQTWIRLTETAPSERCAIDRGN
jgi:hypothetical protein